jgi:hypothetical protein
MELYREKSQEKVRILRESRRQTGVAIRFRAEGSRTAAAVGCIAIIVVLTGCVLRVWIPTQTSFWTSSGVAILHSVISPCATPLRIEAIHTLWTFRKWAASISRVASAVGFFRVSLCFFFRRKSVVFFYGHFLAWHGII